MKIVLCLKQVPLASSVNIDPVTKRLLRENTAAVLNPFDYHAIEEAMRLKEKYGAEVIALTMGPSKAETILREALAFGVDRAVLLSDRLFGGSDTWATSYIISLALKKFMPLDLVLCGRQAVDGDTSQVPAGIAAHLGLSQAYGVVKIENINHSKLTLKRMGTSGYERCEIKAPAVLSVAKELNIPRVPRLEGWLKAIEQKIEIFDAEKLEAKNELIGLNGSPTRVVKTFSPPPRDGEIQVWTGSSDTLAEKLFTQLRKVAQI
ncbi:MAG: electron transfer flavoprotein subunit beta/FixA family protein [Victivallaceae bacterium]|nr:electron transfer flavoprotein subunit beta/FixA family protein [Victivallaceae bacterium]